ncbi:hypothetical protein AZOA_08910 [Azoarcus sp. Aa7]|nr:hypothetical protein [Azoarcus sp. Aa7]
MSGANVPYHMRQNKSVDRMLFIDLLTRLNRYIPIPDYRYVSFGAAFLEDFKLLHSHFGLRSMLSIEMDEQAFLRQTFNLPLRCIQNFRQKSGDFIDRYNSETPTIIWLDYASAKELREQLQEIQALVVKLRVGDVLKVTLNANPEAMSPGLHHYDGRQETVDEKRDRLFKQLDTRLGDFLPTGYSPDDLSPIRFPKMLLGASRDAITTAFDGRRLSEGVYIQPLLSCAYQDGPHQMLTFTVIVLRDGEKNDFLDKTGLNNWGYQNLDWENFNKISVPALTVKEKISIDRLLPGGSAEEILTQLGFNFGRNNRESVEAVENYKKYYRYYPNYQRVMF